MIDCRDEEMAEAKEYQEANDALNAAESAYWRAKLRYKRAQGAIHRRFDARMREAEARTPEKQRV